MKNVLNWFKKHWVIPTLSVAILAILGTTWWFSNSWNEQIRDEQQKKASDLLTKVKGVQVTYALPLVAGETKAVELQTPPNSVITAKFSESRKRIIEQRESVVKIAEAFNKGDKKPLVDGLFPSPAAGQEQLKPLELVQKLIGNPTQGTPSAYQLLLDSIRAGGPIASTQLEAQLNDIYRREAEKLRGANATRELTQPEKESLARQLLDARRSEYIRRANEVSVYADMSVFPSAGGSSAPGSGMSQARPPSAANQDPAGRLRFATQRPSDVLRQSISGCSRMSSQSSGNANSGDSGKLVSERDSPSSRESKKSTSSPGSHRSLRRCPATTARTEAARPHAMPQGRFHQSISGHGSHLIHLRRPSLRHDDRLELALA